MEVPEMFFIKLKSYRYLLFMGTKSLNIRKLKTLLCLGIKERRKDLYIAKNLGWTKIRKDKEGFVSGICPESKQREVIPFYCSDVKEAYRLSKYVKSLYPSVYMSIQEVEPGAMYWAFWDTKNIKGKERRLEFIQAESLPLAISTSAIKVLILLKKRYDCFVD